MNGMRGDVDMEFIVNGKAITLGKLLEVETKREGNLAFHFEADIKEAVVVPKKVEPTKEEVEQVLDQENIMPVLNIKELRMKK